MYRLGTYRSPTHTSAKSVLHLLMKLIWLIPCGRKTYIAQFYGAQCRNIRQRLALCYKIFRNLLQHQTLSQPALIPTLPQRLRNAAETQKVAASPLPIDAAFLRLWLSPAHRKSLLCREWANTRPVRGIRPACLLLWGFLAPDTLSHGRL
jgi:hypothetical protein